MTLDVSRRSLLALGAGLGATAVMGEGALAKAPKLGTQSPYWHRLNLGNAEVTVISDGPLSLGDPKGTFTGVPDDEIGGGRQPGQRREQRRRNGQHDCGDDRKHGKGCGATISKSGKQGNDSDSDRDNPGSVGVNCRGSHHQQSECGRECERCRLDRGRHLIAVPPCGGHDLAPAASTDLA